MTGRKYIVRKHLAGGNKKYRKWSDYETGDVVVGKFVGTVVDQYEKTNMVIDVEYADFKDGTSNDYVNSQLVLNSCGTLDKAMEDLTIGELIQVEYTGKVVMEKGKFAGKEAHTLSVQVVEEDGSADAEIDL